MNRTQYTMTLEEQKAWIATQAYAVQQSAKQETRRRRAWTLEELWEQQVIFASQGLRDTAEFLYWLERQA